MSQVLDLTLGPEQLRKDMSKGHRAATKKGKEQFTVTTPDSHAALHAFRADPQLASAACAQSAAARSPATGREPGLGRFRLRRAHGEWRSPAQPARA